MPEPALCRRVVARLIAYGLPLFVVIVGVTDANVWPATGWRLFSDVRSSTQVSWFIEVEDDAGQVHRFDPADHDPAQSQWRHQIQVSAADPTRQGDLCLRWLAEARSVHPAARSLSVRRALIEIPRSSGESARMAGDREVVGCRR